MREIKQGQIWEVVTDNFLTSGDKEHYNRQTKIKKGEKIEIRYPYAWHFRCEDNHYFHADESVIFENCRLYGVIWSNVQFANKARLDEILRLNLFDRERR